MSIEDQPGFADLIASGGIVGDPDPGPPTANISAMGRCNGLGEGLPEGSYVRVAVACEYHGTHEHYRLSVGAAENLLAELQGCLAGSTGNLPRADA